MLYTMVFSWCRCHFQPSLPDVVVESPSDQSPSRTGGKGTGAIEKRWSEISGAWKGWKQHFCSTGDLTNIFKQQIKLKKIDSYQDLQNSSCWTSCLFYFAWFCHFCPLVLFKVSWLKQRSACGDSVSLVVFDPWVAQGCLTWNFRPMFSHLTDWSFFCNQKRLVTFTAKKKKLNYCDLQNQIWCFMKRNASCKFTSEAEKKLRRNHVK